MSHLHRFGQFVLDPRKRTLFRADKPVSLTPKAFDVLAFLAQNPRRLLTREELLQAVWGDTFVEEGILTQYISHLRKALDDSSEDAQLIVTIARKGYQFTADVTVAETGDVPKQLQIPASESSEANTHPRAHEFPAAPTIPRGQKHWLQAVVGACVAILLLLGYMSWWHTRAKTPPVRAKVMLAVLPFANFTGDPNKEYLADGLTEEMISQLGRLKPEQLGVIGRTSVTRYKHKEEQVDQIGRDLSVQYVLENSFRQSGDHLRITSQLIQVKDQSHLWSNDYDYRAQDILTVEDDVAKAVAGQIQVRLTSQQEAALERSQTVNLKAFDAYLQGHYFFERNTDKDTDMAAKYYERATQLDPSYALGWVGLSRARNWQAEEGLIPREEGRRLSREAIERALALNPNLAPTHVQIARIKRFVDFDWAGADASIQRAIALEPGNTDTLLQAAESAALFGRSDEALVLARRAVELDPLSPASWNILGEIKYFEGQLAEAEADVKKSLELSPDAWPGPILLARIYIAQGRPQDVLPEIERVRTEPERAFLYAVTHSALGREKQSDAALKELIAKYSTREASLVARVYAFRDQRDAAFEWLYRAYAQRESQVAFTNLDPELKNLHGDPRYASFLTKIHLPN